MLIFKIACDVGYWFLISWDTSTYRAQFNPIKYVLGVLCCLILYFGIEHEKRKASSFLLYLFFLLQIIPITTIYSLENDSSVYYFTVCLAVLLCELLVRYVDSGVFMKRDKNTSILLVTLFALLLVYTVYRMIKVFGPPQTTALNIYSVYDIRKNAPDLGKLLNYLLNWSTAVFLPFALAKALSDRKILLAFAFSAVCILLYLYTAQKTILFMVPMVIACTAWAKRESCYRELFFCFCIGFALLTVLALLEPDHDAGFFNSIFSLFGRRSMIVSANNKFKYFDYFSERPKMGIYGIFPRWLIPVKSYYEDIPYSYEISRIYYGKPEMNSNTGFLAEGYMRFGLPGLIVFLVLFAVILKSIDRFQNRTEYSFAIGAFVYPVFSLNDAHLLDSLFFGPWMILLLILMFYNGHTEQDLAGRGHCFVRNHEQLHNIT